MHNQQINPTIDQSSSASLPPQKGTFNISNVQDPRSTSPSRNHRDPKRGFSSLSLSSSFPNAYWNENILPVSRLDKQAPLATLAAALYRKTITIAPGPLRTMAFVIMERLFRAFEGGRGKLDFSPAIIHRCPRAVDSFKGERSTVVVVGRIEPFPTVTICCARSLFLSFFFPFFAAPPAVGSSLIYGYV